MSVTVTVGTSAKNNGKEDVLFFENIYVPIKNEVLQEEQLEQ